jgi:ATPase subunit of ABC transporter with duplicated ATPase domains
LNSIKSFKKKRKGGVTYEQLLDNSGDENVNKTDARNDSSILKKIFDFGNNNKKNAMNNSNSYSNNNNDENDEVEIDFINNNTEEESFFDSKNNKNNRTKKQTSNKDKKNVYMQIPMVDMVNTNNSSKLEINGDNEDEKNEFDTSFDGKVVLRQINLSIKPGNLVVVVGMTGTGKSTFVQGGLLGECKRLQGNVAIQGTLSYVSQSPWIQNMTLRDNILFGNIFDAERFFLLFY